MDRVPLEQRFWAKVEKRGASECWPWRGSRTPQGYGRIGMGGKHGSIEIASRLSWALHNGPIPPGKHVLHRCDNPPCVNPAHLFIGTAADNIRDMYAKGRGNRPFGEQHCCARLTEVQIQDIRDTYARGGVSQRVLGQQYGVSNVAISRVVRRLTWGHV